ncbi:MAG: cation/multidrug efflux pump [Zhongshania sp.]|uniref:cation/multidrug efflux pump n=1 Tax=Zhongshania sp. TaxID=1971902 RepID=UPI00262B490F|nr:cation/multidrug efflux pump [Zhongshania sp.]MDF1691722.1 cation/multidrug efflux pump [Zhongshania sp.]
MSLDYLFLLISALGLLLCLLAVLRLRKHLFSGSVAVVLAFGFTTGAIVVSKDVLSYRHLADEQMVARVFVGASKEAQEYLVSVDTLDGEALQSFLLKGDQWQIDSRIIRWQMPVARLGLDNLYRLERLLGRYSDIENERNAPRTVYLINLSKPLDVWQWLRSNDTVQKWVDANYGNSVFAPMIDGAQFSVYLSHNGLFIRPENPIAVKALRNWPA